MSAADNNDWSAFDWSGTDLGARSGWPRTLALTVDIVLNTPLPLLLVWGPRRIVVFNEAYADLAGVRHARAPGGAIPSIWPAPLAANPAAIDSALQGHSRRLTQQSLVFLGQNGPEKAQFDLHLTPLPDDQGEIRGVLCGLTHSVASAPLPPSALRILVVEDNLDSQYLVCEMLKAFGHEADGVGHGEGALEMLEASSYDVLFSDVSLPGISGVELARQALARQPALHVIFASGYGDALLRHVAFPYQSLQKPYDIEQLQAALAYISQQRHTGV